MKYEVPKYSGYGSGTSLVEHLENRTNMVVNETNVRIDKGISARGLEEEVEGEDLSWRQRVNQALGRNKLVKWGAIGLLSLGIGGLGGYVYRENRGVIGEQASGVVRYVKERVSFKNELISKEYSELDDLSLLRDILQGCPGYIFFNPPIDGDSINYNNVKLVNIREDPIKCLPKGIFYNLYFLIQGKDAIYIESHNFYYVCPEFRKRLDKFLENINNSQEVNLNCAVSFGLYPSEQKVVIKRIFTPLGEIELHRMRYEKLINEGYPLEVYVPIDSRDIEQLKKSK